MEGRGGEGLIGGTGREGCGILIGLDLSMAMLCYGLFGDGRMEREREDMCFEKVNERSCRSN